MPQATLNIADGVRAHLGGTGAFEVLEYELPSGIGRLSSLLAKAFAVDGVHIAVTNCAYSSLGQVQKVLSMYGRLLLVVSSGADVVRREELHPLVFRYSMLAWQSAYEAGRNILREHGPKTLLVSTLFDCGFDSHSAFLHGSQGDLPDGLPFHICDAPDYDYHADALLKRIADAKPDALAIHAGGHMAVSILSTLASSPEASRLPVIHGPLLHEEPIRSCQCGAVRGKTSYFSWADSLLESCEGARFLREWAGVSKRVPDFFSVCGHDVAMFIRNALEGISINARAGVELARKLEGMEIVGPRGRLEMDREFHTTNGKVYRRHACGPEGDIKTTADDATDTLHDSQTLVQELFAGHVNRWDADLFL
jgi:hypothetical protein